MTKQEYTKLLELQNLRNEGLKEQMIENEEDLFDAIQNPKHLMEEKIEKIKRLRDLGTNVNIQDGCNNTPLTVACGSRYIEIAKLF